MTTTDKPPQAGSDLRRRAGVLGGAVAGIGLVMLPVVQYLEMGRSPAERLATEMAQPLGLLWCGLFMALGITLGMRLFAGRRDGVAGMWWGIGIVWLVITLIGNPYVARAALQATEYPPTDQSPSEYFDGVVLLGGGIGPDPLDRPKLGGDGDRIRPVLQLWQAGLTNRIVVTGTSAIAGRPDPTQLTTDLLVSLGIPESTIVHVEGVNTAAEMENLRSVIDTHDARDSANSSEPGQSRKTRWAVVTSAFHMPRAMRLAQKQGMDLIPIPTAHRLGHEPIGLAATIIPSVGALDDLSRCWKEWLAALVGR
jgi:uncharacterized SAM-binding protein YcdF (DUF218 family)